MSLQSDTRRAILDVQRSGTLLFFRFTVRVRAWEDDPQTTEVLITDVPGDEQLYALVRAVNDSSMQPTYAFKESIEHRVVTAMEHAGLWSDHHVVDYRPSVWMDAQRTLAQLQAAYGDSLPSLLQSQDSFVAAVARLEGLSIFVPENLGWHRLKYGWARTAQAAQCTPGRGPLGVGYAVGARAVVKAARGGRGGFGWEVTRGARTSKVGGGVAPDLETAVNAANAVFEAQLLPKYRSI